jgi:hypothetical protein
VDKNNVNDAYLVMKFGDKALAIANVNENGAYFFTDWAARNGMNNDPDYATALMFVHVNEAAKAAAGDPDDPDYIPYQPIDRYTLSYAPTNGFFTDIWGTLLTKLGFESDSVLGLRGQLEFIQESSQQVNWVAHSRGGAEFVQAALGSSLTDLSNNSVVFHAGANTVWATDWVTDDKKILNFGYRDAPNDLVPQIVGLRALTSFSPLNFVWSLLSAPCLSNVFCTIEQSPHTLPYVEKK